MEDCFFGRRQLQELQRKHVFYPKSRRNIVLSTCYMLVIFGPMTMISAFSVMKSIQTHNVVYSRNHITFAMTAITNKGEDNDQGIGVGIDLGTTNSAIAYLNDKKEPCIIEIPNNGRTIKSIVAFDDNVDSDNDNDNISTVSTATPEFDFSKALVGNDAIEWEQQNKKIAYRHVKRVIGTSAKFLSKETKEVVPHLVVRSSSKTDDVDTDDDINDDGRKRRKPPKRKINKKRKKPTLEQMVQAAKGNPTMLHSLISDKNKDFVSPEIISSCILKKLLDVAGESTGKQITRAVIGIPAYFNDAQRDATIRAANIAGIEKVKLLAEPEAAALAYGVDKDPKQEELILVFDLGGGTYDVSVLLVEKGLTEILCTSGNSQLGGTDFDAKIAKYLSQHVKGCYESEEFNNMLLRVAEEIRIFLSNNRAVDLMLPATEEGWISLDQAKNVILPQEPMNSTGKQSNNTHFIHRLSRAEMERLCTKEFQELLRPIREVAIMAGALLPGDARPGIVDSAIELDSLFLDEENFYSEGVVCSNTMKSKADGQNMEIQSAKKLQQKGRKKARELAKGERKYRIESQRVKGLMPEAKITGDGISGRPITQIVLVGGATRMPAIGRILRSLTGVVPQKTIDPDEAVALGCAVHVGLLDGKDDLGVVLNPLQAAILQAVVDKERRDGRFDNIVLDENEDEFSNLEYF